MDMLNFWNQIVSDAGKNNFGQHIDVNGYRKTIGSVSRDTAELIKTAQAQNLTMLIAPVIESALRELLQLYIIQAAAVLSGEAEEALSRIKKLQSLLSEVSLQSAWNNVKQNIREKIRDMGFEGATERLDDLSFAAPIMIHAANFLSLYGTKTTCVQAGADCPDSPFFYRMIPQFATLAEFYEQFRMVGKGCAVMFATIAPSYQQTTDSLECWQSHFSDGTPCKPELICNIIRNGEKPEDIHRGRSYIAIGVKRGENIWLITSSDQTAWRGSFYEYDKRTSYLPIQQLFKGAQQEQSDCTDLAVVCPSWDMGSIADEEQVLWLPMLFWQLQEKYFAKLIPDTSTVKMMGELTKSSIGVDDALLHVLSTRHTLEVDVFSIPEGIETDHVADIYIANLGLTATDIADAPIGIRPEVFGTEEEFAKLAWLRARYALAKVVGTRLADLYADENQSIQRLLNAACGARRETILEAVFAPDNRLHQIASITLNNEPVVDPNGQSKLDARGKPVLQKTSVCDTKERRRKSGTVLICEPVSLQGKRPYALLQITPKTGLDYSLLTDIPLEELPWYIRYIEMGKPPLVRIHVPDLGAKVDPMVQASNPFSSYFQFTVSIAMTKTAYKQRRGSLDSTTTD